MVGTLLAAGVFAACSAIVGASAAAPFVVALPLALVSWVLSYYLFKGGRSLEKSGEDRQKATRTQAVYALANMRAGMVTPADLAQAIGVAPTEADDILTAMAKESPDHVSIEVDDNGTLYYRFAAAHWGAIAANAAGGPGVRVGPMAPNAPAPGGRVGPLAPSPPTAEPRVSESVGPQLRVGPRDPLDDEFAGEPPEGAAAGRHAR